MTANTSLAAFLLNDGTSLPPIGFGTFGMRGEDGIDTIITALEHGYRLLDTAVGYGNEVEVSRAQRRSGVAAGLSAVMLRPARATNCMAAQHGATA